MVKVSLPSARHSRLFYGWWIVIVTAMMSAYLAGVVFWSFSFFVSPIRQDLGWSAGTISIAYLIQGAIGALSAPLFGALFDRFGPKVVAGGGILLGGLGLVFMGTVNSPWQFTLAFTLAGFAPIAVFGAGVPAVANWFVRRRGLALGLQSLGVAFAGAMAPIVSRLVDGLGWRTALMVLGIGAWALLPLVLVLRRRPEEYGLTPDGDGPIQANASGALGMEEGVATRDALRGPTFWLLGFAIIMAFWGIGGIQVHLSPYLEGIGISRELAATVMAVLSVATVLGRVFFGWLADRTDLRWLMASALVIQAVGLVVFALVDATRAWLLIVFLLTFSPALGGIMVLQSAIQGHYFGRRSFGALAGLYYALSSVSWASAPYLMGLLYDGTGSYRLGFLLVAAFSVVGVPALLALRRRGTAASTTGTPSAVTAG